MTVENISWRSFSPFHWFKKGSCQFLAKECAQYCDLDPKVMVINADGADKTSDQYMSW